MSKQTLAEQRKAYMLKQQEIKEWQLKQRAEHPNDWMPAYRPSSKMKEGIESLPTYFHTGDLGKYLRSYKKAQELGAPAIPPEKFAAMALVEARHDIGYNDWNKNNPRAVKLYNDLIKQGQDPTTAGFSAAILDKYETAQRLKIPFETAWNGTGKSIWNKSGKDYANKVKEAEKVLEHPKNKPLYNFIKGTISSANDVEDAEGTPALAGIDAVPMPEEYSDGNWKLI